MPRKTHRRRNCSSRPKHMKRPRWYHRKAKKSLKRVAHQMGVPFAGKGRG